jgi:hypothetical protein
LGENKEEFDEICIWLKEILDKILKILEDDLHLLDWKIKQGYNLSEYNYKKWLEEEIITLKLDIKTLNICLGSENLINHEYDAGLNSPKCWQDKYLPKLKDIKYKYQSSISKMGFFDWLFGYKSAAEYKIEKVDKMLSNLEDKALLDNSTSAREFLVFLKEEVQLESSDLKSLLEKAQEQIETLNSERIKEYESDLKQLLQKRRELDTKLKISEALGKKSEVQNLCDDLFKTDKDIHRLEKVYYCWIYRLKLDSLDKDISELEELEQKCLLELEKEANNAKLDKDDSEDGEYLDPSDEDGVNNTGQDAPSQDKA